MRLWSLHPSLLDTKGLVAAWREGLLAKAVLKGETIGYRNHPQLLRFKVTPDPVAAVNSYLQQLFLDSERRGYRFNKDKLEGALSELGRIEVTSGQVEYEYSLLKTKLMIRDKAQYAELLKQEARVNSVFVVTPGPIEPWEVVRTL